MPLDLSPERNSAPPVRFKMDYRGIEYAVIEGIGRHMWKWSAFAGGAIVTGQAHSKQVATVAAEWRRLRRRRLLIAPSPLRRSDLSRPSDPIDCGGCRDKGKTHRCGLSIDTQSSWPKAKAATMLNGDGFRLYRSRSVTYLDAAQSPTVWRHHALPNQVAATVVVSIAVVPGGIAVAATVGIWCRG
jgi:hypothetical protein